MATVRTLSYSGGFGVAALVCLAVAYCLAYWSGCVGDPKGGSLGDPVLALEIEAKGSFFLMLGLAAAVFFIGLRSDVTALGRIKYALLFLLLGSPLLWFLAVQLEIVGTQLCF